jgi:hypothetical protein
MYRAAAWPNEGSIYTATILPRRGNVKNFLGLATNCIGFVRKRLPLQFGSTPGIFDQTTRKQDPFNEDFLL